MGTSIISPRLSSYEAVTSRHDFDGDDNNSDDEEVEFEQKNGTQLCMKVKNVLKNSPVPAERSAERSAELSHFILCTLHGVHCQPDGFSLSLTLSVLCNIQLCVLLRY
jgi:hypothetical protein